MQPFTRTDRRYRWLSRYHASIPLYALAAKLGVLNVAPALIGAAFAPEDLRLLYTIGDTLSIRH